MLVAPMERTLFVAGIDAVSIAMPALAASG
jgi:hypothetical protein